MDIWAWVDRTEHELRDSGQGRLADIIGALPNATVNDQHDEVAAMAPEGRALAQALEMPWVEIYVRHWAMQADNGGFTKIPEAVDLLEFSHREEHKACPQSVCTVQDVAMAYAAADGPGFAQERLDVSRETLDRIDPSWPCFTCISGEHASALVDVGRHEEALAFVDQQRATLEAAGVRPSAREVLEADALLALGRAQEALDRLDEADRTERDKDDTFARKRRQRRVLTLLALGRPEDAREHLLPLDLVAPDAGYHLHWALGVQGLAAAGAYDNDWRLGTVLERMLRSQIALGRVWEGVQLAAVHAHLALDRGAPTTARHALEAARGLAGKLREPSRAEPLLDELAQRVDAHPPAEVPPLPASAEELLDAVDAMERPDPEEHVEWLQAARERWPDESGVAQLLANALSAIGRGDDARRVLREFADAHPDELDAWLDLGFTLIDQRRSEELEELAGRLEERHADEAAWLRACLAWELGDHRAAARHAARTVELDPDAVNARRMHARAAERTGDYEAVVAEMDAVLAAAREDDDVGSDHWLRMVGATVLGRWDAVRESAAAVGIELDEEAGPIDEEWSLVRLRYDVRDIALGVRTGPVSAKVISADRPGAPAHAGDRVVFDPMPLDEPEDEDDEAPRLVRVVEVVEPGRMTSYEFDGVDPGEEAWTAFRDALRDRGWLVDSRFYGDEYVLHVEGEALPGLYGILAVPESTSAAEAHALMGELTAGWQHPFTWLPLAEAAHDDEAVATQRQLAADLALY